MYCLGMVMRCGEQEAQTTLPHLRQWCFRYQKLNTVPQIGQFVTSASGCHLGIVMSIGSSFPLLNACLALKLADPWLGDIDHPLLDDAFAEGPVPGRCLATSIFQSPSQPSIDRDGLSAWLNDVRPGCGGEEVISIAVAYDEPGTADGVFLGGSRRDDTSIDAERCGSSRRA